MPLSRIIRAEKMKFLILVFMLLYLILPIISWNKLLADLEVGFQYAADAINNKGAKILAQEHYWNTYFTIHTPLYVYSLAVVFRILGPTTAAARLFGLSCVIITAFFVYMIFKEIFGKNKDIPALMASFFYLSNPLVIQGSLFLDIDNTILTMLLMMFTFLYLKWQETATLKKLLALSAVVCLILWSKITTSLVIILLVPLFQLFNGRIKKSLYHGITVSLAGIGLFLLTFGIHCWMNHSANVFNYLYYTVTLASDKQLYGTLFFKLFTVVKILMRLTLWISPFMLILALAGLIGAFKKRQQYNKALFLIIYSGIIFLVYLYVGGSHVFPKYHMPIMPALAIFAAAALPFDFDKIKIKHILLFVVVITVLTLYYIYAIGDMLLTTNYQLKQAIISGAVISSGIVKKITLQCVFYFLPFCLGFLFILIKKHKVRFSVKGIYALLVFAVSVNLGLNILQAKSDYNHMDHYGVPDGKTKEVLKFIKENINPTDKILAPVDINYFLGRYDLIYIDYDTWSYPDYYMKKLNDRSIKCFVYRITNVSLPQFDNVLKNSEVKRKLERNFRYYDFGPYFVWLRKN